MVSFIFYGSNNNLKNECVKTIKRFLYTTADCYKIYEFETFNSKIEKELEHIEGVRIYILDLDNPTYDTCTFARKIREKRDIESQIILITERDKSNVLDDLNNILYLDLLTYDDNLEKALMKSINDAYEIVTRHSVYSFSSFDEVYRLPYNDVYIINKNKKSDSVTIYTKDDSYIHNVSLNFVDESLNVDPRFLKVHRSSIINIHKVSFYDVKSNTIYFDNGMQTSLISRDRKSVLIDTLKNFEKRVERESDEEEVVE